jgi:hypothetical protein
MYSYEPTVSIRDFPIISQVLPLLDSGKLLKETRYIRHTLRYPRGRCRDLADAGYEGRRAEGLRCVICVLAEGVVKLNAGPGIR